MMDDSISRQAAIDAMIDELDSIDHVPQWVFDRLSDRILQLPSEEPKQTKMIKEIREWINSGNRGSADYFIVDKIEEIINKYE